MNMHDTVDTPNFNGNMYFKLIKQLYKACVIQV